MPPRQAVVNEFEAYRPAIVSGAIIAYHDLREGRPIDGDASRVNMMLPVHLGDASPEALREAQVAEARVNVAVRALARLADLRDRSEQGGFGGIMSRVELGLAKIIDRPYVGDELKPGGLVDVIRGVKADEEK